MACVVRAAWWRAALGGWPWPPADGVLGDNPAMTTWLDSVAGIVGPRHLITDPDTLAAACLDWRGRYRGRAQAIARPGSTAEVAALVRACVAAGAPIVPQGGNTSGAR